MKAIELYRHFLSRADWVDREKTNDRIWYGNPEKPIARVGTGWSACAMNLEVAEAAGCDLFISHEHPFAWPWGTESGRDTAWWRRRSAVLDRSGMTLMNLHDTWDHWPIYGIRDSWAEFLELGELVEELDYLHPGRDAVSTGGASLGIYSVDPGTVAVHAGRMAGKIRELGYDGAVLFGNAAEVINTVAIGVGCHIPTFEAFEAGAGLLVVVYDRAKLLDSRIPLVEIGANVLAVEHSVAETPAMRRLGEYIEKTFPGIRSCYLNEEPKPLRF